MLYLHGYNYIFTLDIATNMTFAVILGNFLMVTIVQMVALEMHTQTPRIYVQFTIPVSEPAATAGLSQ